MNIQQGDRVRMLSYGEPVRQFLVLETEECEHEYTGEIHLNALLYETKLDGSETELEYAQRMTKENGTEWWRIIHHYNITWEAKMSNSQWTRVTVPKSMTAEEARQINRYEAGGRSFVRRLLDATKASLRFKP